MSRRRSTPGWRRDGWLVLLVLLGPACTLFGVGRKQEKTGTERMVEAEKKAQVDPDKQQKKSPSTVEPSESRGGDDEEAGVRTITKNLRQLSEALEKKDFEQATKFLQKAQKLVREASVVTRGHPDYEDTEDLVARAGQRLEAAIEADRIARRNAAIDEAIRTGDTTVSAGNALYAELAQRVATAEDVERLDDLLETLDGLKQSGSQYLDEPRYQAHATDRDAKANTLAELRQNTKWAVDATARISATIERAYEAALDAREASDPGTQVADFQKSNLAFKDCVSTIAGLEGEPRYEPTRGIKTRLGELNLADTKRKCAELARQAQASADGRGWEHKVNGVVTAVNGALARLRSPKDAADELKRSHEAADVLAKCGNDLARTDKDPGHDRNKVFDSLLGKLPAAAIADACKRERQLVQKNLPQVEWRMTLAGLTGRLDDVQKLVAAAGAERLPQKAVPLWEKASGGLKECAEQAKDLAKKPGADKKATLVTAYGKLNIGDIEQLCLAEAKKVETGLSSAIVGRDIEVFAATAKGDERDVARREGIPSRIETFAGGRIFIYEQGKSGAKELKRYGFDNSGKRVDYWVEWRNQVVGVAAELTRVLTKVKEAPDAATLSGAVAAATPVLDVCREVLTASKGSPGYDAKAFFKTPLGKHTVDRLVVACADEKKRLEGSLTTIAWRVRLEKLRDRVNQAQADLGRAEKIVEAEARVGVISAAMGGLQECVERVALLPKEDGADPKYKVPSVYGQVDVKGIEAACKTMQGEAKAAADKALADRATEKFILACKADEVEVAKREGVPTQIVQAGTGRVFVYKAPAKNGDKKSKKDKPSDKRFAFDGQGKRVNEELLSAGTGKPEVVKSTPPVEPELVAPTPPPDKKKK